MFINCSFALYTYFRNKYANNHTYKWTHTSRCSFFVPSAPCAPENISSSLLCDNNTAAVSWGNSSGAVFYKVMATSTDGDVKQCTTNDTSCHLPHMHCGQTYNISVTPFSNECKGFDSYPLSYHAGKVEFKGLKYCSEYFVQLYFWWEYLGYLPNIVIFN